MVWAQRMAQEVSKLITAGNVEDAPGKASACTCLFLHSSPVRLLWGTKEHRARQTKGLALHSFMTFWRDEESWFLQSDRQLKQEAGRRYLKWLNCAVGGRRVWGVWKTVLVNQLEWILSYQLMNRTRRLFCSFSLPGLRIGHGSKKMYLFIVIKRNSREMAWWIRDMSTSQSPFQ